MKPNPPKCPRECPRCHRATRGVLCGECDKYYADCTCPPLYQDLRRT